MITTIDRGGRVVVPKKLRDQFHLLPGTEVEISADRDGIRVRPRGSEPSLTRKLGFLVHHGSERAEIDVVSFIAAEREARTHQIVAEHPDS
ncbi:MAG: AbrB/MazE/SpoVT family DNA-binding domain-containing protein [Spirochaetaceae bacterium]|nr:MAG: AbrB/MazE/SpoVT family DNA-binding domain-containing protein [Spirochaetaceae bacterium]